MHCQILLGHLLIQKVESDVITLIPSCCVTQQSALPAFRELKTNALRQNPDSTSDWWLLSLCLRPWLLCKMHRWAERTWAGGVKLRLLGHPGSFSQCYYIILRPLRYCKTGCVYRNGPRQHSSQTWRLMVLVWPLSGERGRGGCPL